MWPAFPESPTTAAPPTMNPPPTPVETTIARALLAPLAAPHQCSAKAMHVPSRARFRGSSGATTPTVALIERSTADGKFNGATELFARSMGPAEPTPRPTTMRPSVAASNALRVTSWIAAVISPLLALRPVGRRNRLPGTSTPWRSTSAASTFVPPMSTASATSSRVRSVPGISFLLSSHAAMSAVSQARSDASLSPTIRQPLVPSVVT